MLIVSSFSSQPPYHHHPYSPHHQRHACRNQLFAQQLPGRLSWDLIPAVADDLDDMFAGLHHQQARRHPPRHTHWDWNNLDILAQQQRQRQLELVARRRQKLAQELERRRQVALEARRRQHLQRQRLSQEFEALSRAMEAIFSQTHPTERETLAAETAQAESGLKRAGAVRRVRITEPAVSSTTTVQPTTTTSFTAQAQAPRFTPSDASPIPFTPRSHDAVTQPNVTVAASLPLATSESVRIPIHTGNDEDKVSSNVYTTPAPPVALRSNSPAAADAHVALNRLSSNLDDYLSSSHVWPSPAHRTHALNQLLEQVDAVESDGDEGVRDERRGLVRRVEQALDGQQDSESPVQTRSRVAREDVVGNKAAAAGAAQSSDAASTELVGYDVPDLDNAAPLHTSTPIASPVSPSMVLPPTADSTVQSEWTTVDPTALQPLGVEFVDEEDRTHVTAVESATPLSVITSENTVEQAQASQNCVVESSGIAATMDDAAASSPIPTQEQRQEVVDHSPLEVVAGAPLAESETSSPAVSQTGEQEEADLAEWDTDSESGQDADAFELV